MIDAKRMDQVKRVRNKHLSVAAAIDDLIRDREGLLLIIDERDRRIDELETQLREATATGIRSSSAIQSTTPVPPSEPSDRAATIIMAMADLISELQGAIAGASKA